VIARLLGRWREARRQRALKRRIAAMNPDERAAWLQRAPEETYSEQGMEGAAFVVRKGVADPGEAMIEGGAFNWWTDAEDFIIARQIAREENVEGPRS
jgi:hypothetical protein